MASRIHNTLAVAAAACTLLAFAPATAYGEPNNPNPSSGAGCTMANGKVLKDGEMFQTASGSLIWCTNGQVCRMPPNKTKQTCSPEAGPPKPVSPS